jgi:hypothetical protein
MFEKRIAVQPGQTLTLVELAGNAKLEGYDGSEVVIQLPEGQEEDLSVELAEGGPAVSARESCEIEVPAGVPVAVRQAQGNLKVSELADLNAEQVRGNLKLSEVQQASMAEVYGNLKASEVGTLRVLGTVYGEVSLSEVETADIQNGRGNVRAREVGRLRVSRLAGNLIAKEIGGTLEVDQVGGDAVLKEIGGKVTLDQVAGNLVAKHLAGGARVERIGGELAFRGLLGSGCSYQFKAGGNARFRLEEGTSAHVSLRADGHLVSSLSLVGEERTEQTLSGVLGDGGAELAVEVGGNLLIGFGRGDSEEPAGDEFGRHFEERFEATFEGIGRQVETEIEAAMGRLRVKLEGMDWSRMGERAQEAVGRAMGRLEQDADRLAERVARQEERMRQRAEREAQRAERRERHGAAGEQAAPEAAAVGGQAKLAAPEDVPEPDRDQERLTILKMVEQGQITPRDAEMLLEALG